MAENKKNKIVYIAMVAFGIYLNRLTYVSCLVSLIKSIIIQVCHRIQLGCSMLCK